MTRKKTYGEDFIAGIERNKRALRIPSPYKKTNIPLDTAKYLPEEVRKLVKRLGRKIIK